MLAWKAAGLPSANATRPEVRQLDTSDSDSSVWRRTRWERLQLMGETPTAASASSPWECRPCPVEELSAPVR